MKHFTLLFAILSFSLKAQNYQQYFDGADTSIYNSILIEIDPDTANLWQTGVPQKPVFHSAHTAPNALVTDTVYQYPPGNTSRFSFKIPWDFGFYGILAIQWVQKIDMAPGADHGMVEFSVDDGLTWESIFENPYVYNLYGYDQTNVDSLGFTGTDTTWRNIWLCYSNSWLEFQDTLQIRFTFTSDTLSADSLHDGWMIDNLLAHLTFAHTVGENGQKEELRVYPNPANERLHLETIKVNEFHIIEEMELIDARGRVVERWRTIPTKFFIDTRRHPDGIYQLRIKTNLFERTQTVVIQH